MRDRICNVCAEQSADGSCGLPSCAVCPIEQYLPKIVQTVHAVSSDKMEDYVAALRKNVCAECPNQHGGLCLFRADANCMLNRYFSLIVDAIDEVDEIAAWPQVC